jgi:hypothetical protein
MEAIVGMLFIVFGFGFLGLIGIYTFLNPNRTIFKKNFTDKIKIYLLSKLSFQDNYLHMIHTDNKGNIKIPIKFIMTNIFLILIPNIIIWYMLCSGLFVVFLVLFGFSVKIPNFNLEVFGMIYFIILIIFSYFISISSKISSRVNNQQFVIDNLSSFNLTINEGLKKQLIEEIKIDYDLYKNSTSAAILLIPFIFGGLSNYYRLQDFFGETVLSFIIIILFGITLMNYIYSKYRSNILYIAYSSIVTLKTTTKKDLNEV